MDKKKKRLHRFKTINKVIWTGNGLLLLIVLLLYIIKWLSSISLRTGQQQGILVQESTQAQQYQPEPQVIEQPQQVIKLTPVQRNIAGNMNAISVNGVLIQHENYERFIDQAALACQQAMDTLGTNRIDIETQGAMDESLALELKYALESRLADRAIISVNGLLERIQRNG